MRKLYRKKINILVCQGTGILAGGMGRYPYAAEVVGTYVPDSYSVSKSYIEIRDGAGIIW